MCIAHQGWSLRTQEALAPEVEALLGPRLSPSYLLPIYYLSEKDRHHRSGAGLFHNRWDLYLLLLETSWASSSCDLLCDFALHAGDGLLHRGLNYCSGCWLIALLHLYGELGL